MAQRKTKYRAIDMGGMEPLEMLYYNSEVQDFDLHFVLEDPDFIVMQYTGLQDKDGVEIYEGDVVRCNIIEPESELHGVTCEVRWIDDGFALVKNDEYMQGLMPSVLNKVIVVAGNIYQNPGLV